MARAIGGDFRKLAKLINGVARAAEGALIRAAARTTGGVVKQLAVDGARAGVNPSGRRWKQRKAGGQALRSASTALRLAIYSSGFLVASSKPHLVYHQRGASRRGTKWRLPRRALLPGGRKLPQKWKKAVDLAAIGVFRGFILRNQWHF